VSKLLGHGSVSKTLNIYVHVLAEHLEQFERQRAKVLGISGTYRAPEVVGVAKEQQVALYHCAGWSSLVARRALSERFPNCVVWPVEGGFEQDYFLKTLCFMSGQNSVQALLAILYRIP